MNMDVATVAVAKCWTSGYGVLMTVNSVSASLALMAGVLEFGTRRRAAHIENRF